MKLLSWSNRHHEHVHRTIKIELILALLITFALVASLSSEQYLSVPHYITPLLILLFVALKVVHIIRKGGTLIEDYIGLGVICLFLVLYWILQAKLNPILIIVFIIVLLYSTGFLLWIKTAFSSRKITHFIASYLLTIVMVVFLFAGAYLSNETDFYQQFENKAITFEDALYFSTITVTTVGYGDILPLGVNRVLASIEALLGMVINVVLIGYILSSGRFKNEYD